ncbi:DUF1254 domain-containing protein [Streptomyces sp. HNM0574]|uniref:DUF1254 domain-containing protein n=1 Tax=Streptomyces sp. HNM0574 TaxID=2714954 RepID=UPI00146CED73|nr:DUF1254 domain-containing protein [Streptomyces sp. HNM0574]NLU68781.1 DUF1254 domain-containing protein [Streptomyces sp. HNM0574]
MPTWSTDRSIATPPARFIRADRVERDDSPLSDTLYEARVLDAYTIGVQAYVYGWPAVHNWRIRACLLDPDFPQHAPLGTFLHEPLPADHRYRLFVTPNADLLYSEAFLDLRDEPTVLHVPDTGGMRYWAAQVLDSFTDTAANISSRSAGSGPGDYALVAPGWDGVLPPGVTEVRVPTRTCFILLRTLFETEADLPATRKIQQGFTLTPLSHFLAATAYEPPVVPADDPRRDVIRDETGLSTSLSYFTVLNRALDEGGMRPAEDGLRHLFARIGVGPGHTFVPDTLDSATREGLTRAVADGWKLVQARSATARTTFRNGWVLPDPIAQTGSYGHDYLQRAGVAHRGIYANTAEEYAAMPAVLDSAGRPLNGDATYTIHMDADQLPKVDSYWSITIYTLPDRALPDHASGRTTVNSQQPDLTYQEDGSLDIFIQADDPGPGHHSNWLPCVPGPFQLILRAYGPIDPAIHHGAWPPPAIERT